LGSALGIDGGAIFQIFATEDLLLSPTAIGVAFGLGVLSVPVQIWAARMPLSRARRNLQNYLVIAAVQAWILAVLIAVDSVGGVAMIALGVTVAAEISLSVLFATAWQPLLSQTLSSAERQRLNSRGRAAGGGLLAALLLLFAALNQPGRVAFLVVVGVVAWWSAIDLRRVPAPATAAPNRETDAMPVPRQPLSSSMRLIFVVIALTCFGAWPLFLVYVHDVFWPSANLGVVGALQLTGSLLAALAWRPTGAGLIVRARLAGAALVGTAVVLATIPSPVEHRAAQLATLAVALVGAAALSTVRLALIELAHRSIDEHSSVRAFTLLDVVASTSLQLGLLAGGLLVALSASTADWVVDPYRIYLVVLTGLALAAIGRLGTTTTTNPTNPTTNPTTNPIS
jgi:hypothetical protein